ncbi:MAG: MBL fold metallo-hydrolase [Thermoplasmatota archaeon]
MIFEQIRAEGIAHNSYLIGSKGEASVIDPKRDCWDYLDLTKEHDLTITHIFETHRNEDYVIGSLELKEVVKAEIYHGPNLDFGYGNTVREGDKFTVGSLEFEIIETPGHTDESISILLIDKDVSKDPYMVFTGDALFAGDVGRTDLYGKEERERLAKTLYESLHKKLLKLDDEVIVCPAHGKGSVCGEEISDRPFTTIGYERKNNPRLRLDKKQFIKVKKNEMIHIPPYFKKMEYYNKNGVPILHRPPNLKSIDVEELKELEGGAVQIVDIRSPTSFSGGHIPGSLNIWRKGLPFFIGWVLKYDDPIVLIDDFNIELDKALNHFIRLGYDNIYGYLSEGFSNWFMNGEEVETVDIISVHDFKKILDEDVFILDVRSDKTWKSEKHIPGAVHIYVGEIFDNLEKIPHNRRVYIYCDSGFKTSLAASMLKREDYQNITSVLGGMSAWDKMKYPLE